MTTPRRLEQLVEQPLAQRGHDARRVGPDHVVPAAEAREALMNERQIMAMLHHPFICELITTFKNARWLYMLMEFAQGGDLYGRLDDAGALPESLACALDPALGGDGGGAEPGTTGVTVAQLPISPGPWLEAQTYLSSKEGFDVVCVAITFCLAAVIAANSARIFG